MSPINKNDISALESHLNAFLPETYIYLLSNYGLVHSPNVFSKICDLNADIAEVQDFLSLEDVKNLSALYELSGMPKGHILFASDCKGNMFCFKLSDCQQRNHDIPVWFYNQQLCTIEQVSPSFSAWLAAFNDL
ncbi:SMI1/KNR4 family protein [Thalassotalea sp. PLHSN55]|uniref:SMI1/KNR4 family protein n=1 Tax=Thalassotalea sp. PLHSN55 TaxID=3435888 RepID=UPI003F83D5C4